MRFLNKRIIRSCIGTTVLLCIASQVYAADLFVRHQGTVDASSIAWANGPSDSPYSQVGLGSLMSLLTGAADGTDPVMHDDTGATLTAMGSVPSTTAQ